MEHSNSKQNVAIGILRVSSTKQGMEGDSPKNQQKAIIPYSQARKDTVVKWFKFIESASEKAKKQPVLEVIEYCKSHPEIKRCYIKSIDRFTRGGAMVYEELSNALNKLGVTVVDTYGVISEQVVNTMESLGKKYSWSSFRPSKKSEMFEAERAKDEFRDIMTRLVGGSVDRVREGYAIGEPPYGYENTRIEAGLGKRAYKLLPNKGEAPFIIRMFELMAEGKKLEEVVETINAMGFKTRKRYRRKKVGTRIVRDGKIGEVPLSEKQLRRFIKNPIYCGVSIHKHLTWFDYTTGVEHFAPILMKGKPLISIDLWNRANQGKKHISIFSDNSIKIFKGETPERFIKKSKSNAKYPYKGYLICHQCNNPLKASAPRNKSGNHIPIYHCSLHHKYWGTNGKKLHENIEKFVDSLEFSDEFRKRFRGIMLEEWEKRRDSANEDSLKYEKTVSRIKEEQRLVLDTLKGVSLESMRKEYEREYHDLEQTKLDAIEKRNSIETEEINIQTVIAYCNYWMEHLNELLIDRKKPLESARLFSLCFDVLPTVPELINGTPKLSVLFRLNEQYNKGEKTLSEPAGTRTQDILLKRQTL